MRLRIPLLAVSVGIAGVFLFTAASLAEDPAIEATGSGVYGYYWSPSSAEVSPGGSVTFSSPSASVQHGVTWTSGPESPKCTGVPIDDFKTSWSGSCTFAQAGVYAFKCYVHPTEMTGKITVGSSGTPNQPPPSGSPGSPAAPPLEALRLAKRQRGGSVRGSVDISPAGAGSRLQVDVFATRAKLFGAGHPGKMRVGLLTRSSLSQGHIGFRVSLKGVARRALKQVERLPLQVKITLTPPQGEVLRRTRAVVLRV
jgi:plastocyanin